VLYCLWLRWFVAIFYGSVWDFLVKDLRWNGSLKAKIWYHNKNFCSGLVMSFYLPEILGHYFPYVAHVWSPDLSHPRAVILYGPRETGYVARTVAMFVAN